MDMNFDRVALNLLIPSINAVFKNRSRKYVPRIFSERFKNSELPSRQSHILIMQDRHSRHRVDGQGTYRNS